MKGIVGVAFWADLPENARSFTIFASGLTNAWSAKGDTINRKVLKIDFKRQDEEMTERAAIQAGPPQWVHRARASKVSRIVSCK
jgi:hypothetical protein